MHFPFSNKEFLESKKRKSLQNIRIIQPEHFMLNVSRFYRMQNLPYFFFRSHGVIIRPN